LPTDPDHAHHVGTSRAVFGCPVRSGLGVGGRPSVDDVGEASLAGTGGSDAVDVGLTITVTYAR